MPRKQQNLDTPVTVPLPRQSKMILVEDDYSSYYAPRRSFFGKLVQSFRKSLVYFVIRLVLVVLFSSIVFALSHRAGKLMSTFVYHRLEISRHISIISTKIVTTNIRTFKQKILPTVTSDKAILTKGYWNFMSGSAAFDPVTKTNWLVERVFYSSKNGPGHATTILMSFMLLTPWAEDWSKQLALGKIVWFGEPKDTIYVGGLGGRVRETEGPEDGRAFWDHHRNMLSVNFNMYTPDGSRQMYSTAFNPSVPTPTAPLNQYFHENSFRAHVEKNWTPIDVNGSLHYIYSLEPLRIIKCKANKSVKPEITGTASLCTVEFDGPEMSRAAQTGELRPGTNWVEFSPGVFFSIARTRVNGFPCSDDAIYRPHLVILKFDVDIFGESSNPRLIYASEPMSLFDDLLFDIYLHKGKVCNHICKDRRVLTPGSITNWTGIEANDFADVIFSVNDEINVILKVEGLGAAVREVLHDEIANPEFYKFPRPEGQSEAEIASRNMIIFIKKHFL